MKLKAEISGQEKELNVSLAGAIVTATVDGRMYEFTLSESGRSDYVLHHGLDVLRCRVYASSSRNVFSVSIRNHNYDVVITDPKRLRASQNSAGHHAGTAEIVSPMPGKVVRVLVEIGANVTTNTGIVIVEAMKMQNEMKAPKAGVVVTINTKEGDTVNAGDVLAVIE
jgi:biotin carboxyl carrier protein